MDDHDKARERPVGHDGAAPADPPARAPEQDGQRSIGSDATTDPPPTTPAGPDLSHLGPRHVRVGSVGVFAGDWAWTPDADGGMRIAVGFVGVLIDTWNGFAVFACTRTVAEAIVADQRVHRDRLHTELIERGLSSIDADLEVDMSLARMSVDGAVIVVDQSAVSGDADAISRIEPDQHGQYVVMGGSGCWQAVDPDDCDRIVGDLPAPGEQQQFVELPHTGLRVPHDRLRVTGLQATPGAPEPFAATLALDATVVAEARATADGCHLSRLSATFSRSDWAAYRSGCRYHGQPVSEARVLDALVTEYQVGQGVREAEADGAALTRLLDAHGTILRLRPVWPAPTGHIARTQLGQRLCRADPHPRGHLWQLWTGAGWQHLASITGFHAVADLPARQPTTGQVLAYVIADSLLEALDWDQLVRHAAGEGIPLDRRMSEHQIRALLRDVHREQGRRAGLPVNDLPTLSAAEGLELGRIATGGGHPDRPATTDLPTPSDRGQPRTP